MVYIMTLDQLREKLSNLKVWKKGGKHAPHKPFLLLWAMGRAARGKDRLVPFAKLEKPLTKLLERFGPPNSNPRPIYPFSHLMKDELWEVSDASSLSKTRGGDFLVTELRERGVLGGLPEPVYRLLVADPSIAKLGAQQLLDKYFHASKHHDILEAVGLRSADAAN